MEKQEVKRIKFFLKSIEIIFPENETTHNVVNTLSKKIKNIDKSIFRTAESLCKEETQNFNQYALTNENMEIEMKPEVDEIKYEKSLGDWRDCLQNKHTEFARLLHEMDVDITVNNKSVRQCCEDCTVDCMGRTLPELTNCQQNCFERHGNIFRDSMMKYDDAFGELEKKYQMQEKL